MTKKSMGIVLTLSLAACGGNKSEARAPDSGVASEGATSSTTAAPAGAGANDLSDLEAKRMVDGIQADIPKHKARFKELCGTDVDIVIDWASFGHDKTALQLLWSNLGVERLVAPFEGVCHDRVGKDAVKAKVKVLKAVNVRDKQQIKATLAGGTFTAALNWSGGAPGMTEAELGAVITKSL